MNFLKKLSLIAVISLISNSSVHPYSFNCFSIMTGEKTVAFNPRLTGGEFKEDTYIAAEAVLSLGFTDNIDLWANLGAVTLYPDQSYDSWWLMPRFDIRNNNIIGLMINDEFVSLQYHTCQEKNTFILQANVGMDLVYDLSNDLTIWTIISPGIKIGDYGFDVYCEIKPSYTTTGDITLNLTPGVGAALGRHLFSLGVDLGDVTTKANPTIGLWWFFAIVAEYIEKYPR